MRIEIVLPSSAKAGSDIPVRVLLFNDDFDPVDITRESFVGPNLTALEPKRPRYPDEVEEPEETQNLTLEPFTFYGRERSFKLEAGSYKVAALYDDATSGRIDASERFEVK